MITLITIIKMTGVTKRHDITSHEINLIIAYYSGVDNI